MPSNKTDIMPRLDGCCDKRMDRGKGKGNEATYSHTNEANSIFFTSLVIRYSVSISYMVSGYAIRDDTAKSRSLSHKTDEIRGGAGE